MEGGEKIFQLLGKLAQNPAADRDLLEFIWVVLSLGFEGRYAALDNGPGKLAGVREKLFQLLQKNRPPFERELAPHWKVTPTKRNPMLGWLPLWVTGAIAAAALLLIYIGFAVALNRMSDPVYAAIQSLRQPQMATEKPRLANTSHTSAFSFGPLLLSIESYIEPRISPPFGCSV